MTTKVATFPMFDGQAEEAITFYVSLFEDARLTSITRYAAGKAVWKAR